MGKDKKLPLQLPNSASRFLFVKKKEGRSIATIASRECMQQE